MLYVFEITATLQRKVKGKVKLLGREVACNGKEYKHFSIEKCLYWIRTICSSSYDGFFL